LQEVQDLFRPQGTLWSLVQGKFGATLQRQNSMWAGTGPPGFLLFLNRAQQFADTLFPNNSPNVHLTYSLRRLPGNGIEQATLIIDGQTLVETGSAQQFVWQGRDSSVSLAVTVAGQKYPAESYQGPWALFEFFDSAEKWTGVNPATLDWPIKYQVKIGKHQVGETSVPAVQYELNTQGSQVFKRDFLNSLRCSSR
jgi:type VI protein secretion system component VasK